MVLQLVWSGQGEVAKALELDFVLLLHNKALPGTATLKEKIESWTPCRRSRAQRWATKISVGSALVFGPDLDNAFRKYAKDAGEELISCRRGTLLLKKVTKRRKVLDYAPSRCGSLANGGLPRVCRNVAISSASTSTGMRPGVSFHPIISRSGKGNCQISRPPQCPTGLPAPKSAYWVRRRRSWSAFPM